jgi:hypothetical protein
LLNRTRSTLNADAVVLLRHYVQMLRRHIVDDPEIEALCRQVYQKHHRALDLIYQYRPDRQARLQGFLESLVRDAGGFDLDTRDPRRSPRYIVFAAKAWEDFEPTPPTDWHSMSLFFENAPDQLALKLALSSDLTKRHERVFAVARQNLPFCKPIIRPKYNWVYKRILLNPREWNDAGRSCCSPKLKANGTTSFKATFHGWRRSFGRSSPIVGKVMDRSALFRSSTCLLSTSFPSPDF